MGEELGWGGVGWERIRDEFIRKGQRFAKTPDPKV